MIELSPSGKGLFKLGFAGDTYTTSVYIKRQSPENFQVDFITALGTDSKSRSMLDRFRQENIGVRNIRLIENKKPGLYLIENDEQGERYFHYWRSDSAARYMFMDKSTSDIVDLLGDYDLIYLSGISLAILDNQQRDRLLSALSRLSDTISIAFDPNFRESLWPDLEECRMLFQNIAAFCDYAFVTIDDDNALWGEGDLDLLSERWLRFGVQEVVAKNGADGCIVSTSAGKVEIPPLSRLKPVDTTGAGDSFSAGYLGARLKGSTTLEAAKIAHKIAAQVIMHPGGIVAAGDWKK